MSERLKNTLAFVNLGLGASIVLPHGLMTSQFRPLAPDIVFLPNPGLSVATDEVNVTLTNTGPIPLSGSILVEAWHTIERAFADTSDENLPVKPYIVVSAENGNAPPQPPLIPLGTRITIYARLTGDDTTGKGTLALPYRTLPRAMQDVPHVIPLNLWYLIDISGLGLETLPTDYAMPPISTGVGADFDFSGVGPAEFSPFFTPLTIYAMPKLLAAIPPAEAVINPGDILSDVGDPNTGLRTITLTPAAVLAHPSWAVPNILKGSFAIGSLNANDQATVLENTATTITYATNVALTAPIRIMESSTTLTGSVSPTGFFRGVFTASGTTGLSMLGVSVVPPSASGFVGLLSDGCVSISLRLGKFVDVDIENIINRARSCYFATDSIGMFIARGSWAAQSCLVEGIISANELGDYIWRTTKLDGVENLGEVFDTNVGVFPYGVPGFVAQRCLITNGGVIFHGTHGILQNVTINDSIGDAIATNGGFLDLQSVQGAGGPGLGVAASKGALVQADANTTVAGATGALQSGGLAIQPTWATLPQFDITAVAAGGATGSGTNVFAA
jgi:hypothetical protein